MNIDIESVLLSGPPLVMTKGSSKNCRYPMPVVTETKRIVGRIIGRVMWRNRCHEVAPSMAAASCRLHGTDWRPARKMIIAVPKLRQDAIMIRAGIDQFGSPSQLGPGMWNQPSTVLISP